MHVLIQERKSFINSRENLLNADKTWRYLDLEVDHVSEFEY